MCRSTSISGRAASRRASAGSPSSGVAARGELAVDLLELGRGAVAVGHEPVVAGEVARHQLGRRGQARGARVEAPEEALDEAPRDERREQTLGGGVEGADVERARVAQRGVGGARRERLVHVDEVELDGAQQFLDRARDVDRQRRRRAGGRRCGTSSTSPTAITRGVPVVGALEQRARLAPRAARSALRDARTRSCERDGASTSTRCPRRESSPRDARDVGVDLVAPRASHGYGVTWAIEKLGEAIERTIIGRVPTTRDGPRRLASPGAFACARLVAASRRRGAPFARVPGGGGRASRTSR